MAWKYPKRPINGSYVIDIDAINQNFLSVVEESSGHLNEHNFKGPELTLASVPRLIAFSDQLPTTRKGNVTVFGSGLTNALPEGIGYRLYYSEPTRARDPDDLDATSWDAYSGSDFYVTKATSGFSMTHTFIGGITWICCSFTLHNHTVPAIVDYETARDLELPIEKGFGFNVALEVDGAIIAESLVGSGDITQESFMDKTNTGTAVLDIHPKGGGGINGARIPVVVDAVMPMLPGSHTIRVAIQDIRGSNAAQEKNDVRVSTIELFALEILN